jgi:hypothetical protein
MKYIHAASKLLTRRIPFMRSTPTIPTDHLYVIPWPDDVIDLVGQPVRSRYVEEYWLGVLGPTATCLARKFAADLELHPNGFPLDLSECAATVGIGMKGGRQSPFIRALGRLVQFHVAQLQPGSVLAVRRNLPTLSRRHLLRLPASIQERHDAWQREQLQSA